jgi:hypothetical protein
VYVDALRVIADPHLTTMGFGAPNNVYMDPYKNPKMASRAVYAAGESGILSGLNAVISTSPGKLMLLSDVLYGSASLVCKYPCANLNRDYHSD